MAKTRELKVKVRYIAEYEVDAIAVVDKDKNVLSLHFEYGQVIHAINDNGDDNFTLSAIKTITYRKQTIYEYNERIREVASADKWGLANYDTRKFCYACVGVGKETNATNILTGESDTGLLPLNEYYAFKSYKELAEFIDNFDKENYKIKTKGASQVLTDAFVVPSQQIPSSLARKARELKMREELLGV